MLAHPKHISIEIHSPIYHSIRPYRPFEVQWVWTDWEPVRTSHLDLTDQATDTLRNASVATFSTSSTSYLLFPSCFFCFGVSNSHHIIGHLSAQTHYINTWVIIYMVPNSNLSPGLFNRPPLTPYSQALLLGNQTENSPLWSNLILVDLKDKEKKKLKHMLCEDMFGLTLAP